MTLHGDGPESILQYMLDVATQQLVLQCCRNRQRFPDNHVIFDQGDYGDVMYFIVSGTVYLHHDMVLVATLSVGDIFGELAFFDTSCRDASATCTSDVEVATINRQEFEILCKHTFDFSFAIMTAMGTRLKSMNERL